MSQGAHAGYKGGSIQRLDAKTGEAKTLYAECDGHKLSAPNDLVFDKQGGFYFTDLGKQITGLAAACGWSSRRRRAGSGPSRLPAMCRRAFLSLANLRGVALPSRNLGISVIL